MSILLDTEIERLDRRLDRLAAVLGDRCRVTLAVDEAQPFLGQAVVLRAKVVDLLDERPAPGRAVTFTTSWGVLRVTDAFRERRGQTLTLHTDALGEARLTLLPPTTEPLTPEQEDAVNHSLDLLGEGEPEQQREALTDLVDAYRWESNRVFRDAVDIFFRDFQTGRDSVNARDALARWDILESTVIAHVRERREPEDDEQATSVDGSAVLGLSFRNWLPAWLEVFRTHQTLQTQIDTDLDFAAGENRDVSGLIRDAGARVWQFVRGQRGRAGVFVGERVASGALTRLARRAQTDVAGRVHLQDALDAAAQAVGSGGVAGLAGLSQIRAETHRLDRDNQMRVAQVVKSLDENNKRLLTFRGEVDAKIDAKVDIGQFDRVLAGKLDRSEYVTFRGETKSTLDKLATRKSLDQLGLQLGKVVDRTADFSLELERQQEGVTSAIEASSNALKVFQDQVKADLAARVTNTQLTQRLANRITSTQLTQRLSNRVTSTQLSQSLANRVTTTQLSGQLGGFVTKNQFAQDLSKRITADQLKNSLANRVTNTQLSQSLANRITSTQLTQRLANRITSTQLTQRLSNRVTSAQLNNRLTKHVTTTQFTNFQKETQTALKNKLETKAFTVLRDSVHANFDRLQNTVRDYNVVDLQILKPGLGVIIVDRPIVIDGVIRPG